MRIRVSIRQRGKERKGKARPAMAKQAKQDRQADGSSTVVYMHALWLKLCGPSSRMCVCVCAQAPCCSSSALLLFARVRTAPIQQRLYMVAEAVRLLTPYILYVCWLRSPANAPYICYALLPTPPITYYICSHTPSPLGRRIMPPESRCGQGLFVVPCRCVSIHLQGGQRRRIPRIEKFLCRRGQVQRGPL